MFWVFGFDVDIDRLAPHRMGWRMAGVDQSTWFNYDFSEDTWRRYAAEQRKKRREYYLRQGHVRDAGGANPRNPFF